MAMSEMFEIREIIGILVVISICFLLVAKYSKKEKESTAPVKGFLYTIDDISGAQNIWQCQRCGQSTYTNRTNFDLVEMNRIHRLVK